MKKIFTLLFSFTMLSLWANMASPYMEGTLGASAFVSQHVDIEKENLTVIIDENFDYARYDIEYHISTDSNGIKIPLLFYAMDFWRYNDEEQDFQIVVDNSPVEILELPQDFYFEDSVILLNDFENYFFEDDMFEMDDSETNSFYISPSDLKYFETNIDSGEHIIKITYTAKVWAYQDTWVQEKNFRYALSPAQYWKSFNELNITIDASNYNGAAQFASQDSTIFSGIVDYQYTELPYDVVIIEQVIDIHPFAQFLINLEPFNIAIIVFLILLIIHTLLQYRYRKTNIIKSFSWLALIGGLLVPALTLFVFWASYELIYMLLEDMASNRASYGRILAILILGPILFIGYLLFSFSIDFVFKKKKS